MFLDLNSKELYQSLGKEKKVVVLCSRPRQNVSIRHFHVVVGQRRQRNVQKSLMRVQSCCFANKTYCFFALSSKSQFVPTRKHTNLGCDSLQAKRSVYSRKD